jgi:hypothetical protein
MSKLKQSLRAPARDYRTLTKKADQLTSKTEAKSTPRELKASQPEVTLRLPALEVTKASKDLTRKTHKLIEVKYEGAKKGTASRIP